MTDTHTHILPGMDDGAANVAESLRMLRACRDQGVDTVVLTPHYHPSVESLNGFLKRREQAYRQLCEAVTEDLPRLVLGAEVAWCPGLDRMDRIKELAMGQTDYLLLEMPFMSWTDSQLKDVYHLASAGAVVPVLAHVERYLHLQHRGQHKTLQQLQIPMQLSAGMFQKPFGGKIAMRLMSRGQWMIGSDCHNMKSRRPCMDVARQYLERHCDYADDYLNWQL